MVEVWMFIFKNTILAFATPAGSLRWLGRESDVLRRILSRFLCRFQNSPLRSSSLSLGSGRCRCVRLRPKRHAIKQTPAKEDKLAAPSGFIDSRSDRVRCGLLLRKASSLAGRLVRIWNISLSEHLSTITRHDRVAKSLRKGKPTSFSSISTGQPVPMLAYRSSQNAIQNVRRRSSLSVQSLGGGKHCLTSSPTPSSRCRPIICASLIARPVLIHALGKNISLNSYVAISVQVCECAIVMNVSPCPFISSLSAYFRARW